MQLWRLALWYVNYIVDIRHLKVNYKHNGDDEPDGDLSILYNARNFYWMRNFAVIGI